MDFQLEFDHVRISWATVCECGSERSAHHAALTRWYDVDNHAVETNTETVGACIPRVTSDATESCWGAKMA